MWGDCVVVDSAKRSDRNAERYGDPFDDPGESESHLLQFTQLPRKCGRLLPASASLQAADLDPCFPYLEVHLLTQSDISGELLSRDYDEGVPARRHS